MYLTQSLRRALRQNPDRMLNVFGDRVRTVAESANQVF